MPKISVVVAAYNVEGYIERCLDSLVNQTMSDIEIIVVNDGSKDSTLEKVNQYTGDSRIKVIDKKNGGLIEARKSGLSVSRGEYVQFVDGDDWLKKDACEKLYNKASEESLDILWFNLCYAYEDGKNVPNQVEKFQLLQNEEYLDLVLKNQVRANAVLQMIKRRFIIDNNIEFPKDVTYGEDLLITAMLACNNPRVGMIEEPLYFYFQRSGSITRTVSRKVFDVIKVINKIEEMLNEKKLMTKHKEQFEFLAYMHLYFYRIIETQYVEEIHGEVFKLWKDRGLKLEENVYYQEFLKKQSTRTKMKIAAYNVSFDVGKGLTNCIYKIKKKVR